MLADGRVVTASREAEPELFAHAVGGYGLFGVILSAELEVVPNDIYASERRADPPRPVPGDASRGSRPTPRSALTYTPSFDRARLAARGGSGLFLPARARPERRAAAARRGRRDPLAAAVRQPRQARPLAELAEMVGGEESGAPLRELHDHPRPGDGRRRGLPGQPQRPDARQRPLSAQQSAATRPTSCTNISCRGRGSCRSSTRCATAFREEEVNLVNASIRAVDAEHNALELRAARRPSRSCSTSTSRPTREGTERMRRLTSRLIDLTHRFGGRFFLPYQLHYTPEQLERSYPNIRDFFAAKRRWDPEGRFSNSWYARYAPALAAPVQPRPAGPRPPARRRPGRARPGRARAITAPRRISTISPPARAMARTAADGSPTTATWRPAGPRKGMSEHDRRPAGQRQARPGRAA